MGVGSFEQERVLGFSYEIWRGVVICAIDAQVLCARGFEGEQNDVLRGRGHGWHGAVRCGDEIIHMLRLEVADDSGFLIGEVVEEVGPDELAVRVASSAALPRVGVS